MNNLNEYLRASVIVVATLGFAGILFGAVVNGKGVDASIAALLIPILGAAIATPVLENVKKRAMIKEVDKLTDEIAEDRKNGTNGTSESK